jgi:hypothetical protein
LNLVTVPGEPSSDLGGIGLGLMAAFSAPDGEPDLGSGSTAEGHRWTGLGFSSPDRADVIEHCCVLR